MEDNKKAYTKIPAGSTFPNYFDHRVATELGFKLTYTSSASGKLFGALLHLPPSWTAKVDYSSINSNSYFVYDEYNCKRGFIVYNYCEVNKDSHIVTKESFLDVFLHPRFEIYVKALQTCYRIELTDYKDDVTYYSTCYYSNSEKCAKKCIQQKELLVKCLPEFDSFIAYWNSEDDLLQKFFTESDYVWEKVTDVN